MRNEYKVWRSHGSYFFKCFPKQNVTVMWDSNTKNYQFLNGIIDVEKKKSTQLPVQPKKQNIFDIKYIALGASVGILLGIAVGIGMILK